MASATPDHEAPAVQPAAGATLHRRGLTGRGVGIAVIDSGVTAPGELGTRLVVGPDFTVDGGTVDAGRDRTGHGTHLAGIAAGDRTGVAPGAHVVSLKVAAEATDVGAVIAGIDWAIAHRHQLSIGVVLLAFGADHLPGGDDPLAAAVARAWRAGIVVVVASGNGGGDELLSTPAHIDEVLTVAGVEQVDGRWTLCDFSDRGIEGCRPDLAAPARSIVGPVAPGSDAEAAPASSFVADGFVKGSGTSQAAAVVAGAVALLLEADPTLTPDEIKQVLTASAVRTDEPGAGAGAIDLEVALACLASGLFRTSAAATPTLVPAGHSWNGHSWNGLEWAGHSWNGHSWNGLEWAGHSWNGHSWNGHSWNGHSWNGHSWNGLEWAGHSWNGLEWAGHSWNGHSWNGHSWNGHSWNGLEWAGHSWNGHSWNGHSWNGHSWNGHSWNGHSWNGHSWNGHSWNGHSWNGHSWNGLEWAGHSWNGHSWNGHSWNGHSWNGHSWNGHSWNGHSWNGLEWAGHSWNGHSWNGLEWAGHSWNGLEWAGHSWN